MKNALLVLSLALAGVASAEFDFQAQVRYNPTGPVRATFSHIVPDGSNGFYAAGALGVDAFVARFDAAGTLLTSRLWDSPSMDFNATQSLVRDAAGRIYATYVGASVEGRFVVQYSPSLQQNWAYHYDHPSNQAITATLDSGETAVAFLVGSSVDVRLLSPDGVVTQSFMIPGCDNLRALCAVPTADSSRGFAVSGRKGNQGWIARFNLSGTVLFNVQDSAMSGSNVAITHIAADQTGMISGVGNAGPTANTGFYKITSTGVVTHAFDPTFPATPAGFNSVEILDASTARTRYQGVIVDFDRNSLSVLRRYASDGHVQCYAENVGGMLLAGIWYAGPAPRFMRWTTPGIGDPLETSMVPNAAATRSGGLAQFVGRNAATGRAAISTTISANRIESEDVLISGYSHRILKDSAMGPTGEISLLGAIQDAAIAPIHTFAAYTPSGQLKFSRSIPSVSVGEVLALQDGSYALIGPAEWPDSRINLVRVNAQGVITNTRVYNFGADVTAVTALIPGSSDLMMMVIREVGNSALVRIRPDGSFVYNVGYARSQNFSKFIALDSGKFAMAQVMTNGKMAIRRIDPATGLTEKSLVMTSESVRSLIDIPGPAMALVTAANGIVRTRRIDEQSLTVTHTAELTGGRTFETIGVGPSGRVAVGTVHGSVAKVMVYNGLNLVPAQAEFTLPTGVRRILEVEVTNANQPYVLGAISTFTYGPIWVGKYSTDSQLLVEHRPEGTGGDLHVTSTAIWLTGHARTRYKGWGPFASRYTR